MEEKLVDKLSIAIQMLNYAIDNNKSLTQTSIKFKRSEKFLRTLRKRAKPTNFTESSFYDNFIKKYNEFLGKNNLNIKDEIVNEIKDALNGDDLLDKDTVLDNEESEIRTETDTTLELDYRGKEIIKSSQKLLETADVDLDLWKLEREVVNKWDVTMKMKDDSIQTAQNFQVKVWLTKKQDAAQVFNAIDKFKELLAEIPSPQYEVPKLKFNPSDDVEEDVKNIFEINIFDLHIGKLCWSGETGENYDVKIASRRFNEAVSKLLEKAKLFKFERILFPVGNDFFNVDTLLNTTTQGTPQDEDLRWQKTFKLGVELLVRGIDKMRQYAPVDVVVIPGNHDLQRSFYLGETLSAWYKDAKDVTVDTHASPRKYYKFGQVLIGLTHGNEEKESALPLLMYRENKHQISDVTFMEWHLGHFHKKKNVNYKIKTNEAKINKSVSLDENLGTTIRFLSSLSGTDSWHHKKGYVGINKAAEGFIWNYHNGLVSQFNVNIIEKCEE